MSTFAINYCYILYKKDLHTVVYNLSFEILPLCIKYTTKNITVLAPTPPHHLKFAK